MTYKQFFVLMSCFILKQALVAQVVPPPATQAEVNAGANRFKYVTPYTFANSGLISGPTNGVTATTATNIAVAAAASKQHGTATLTNISSTGAWTNKWNAWQFWCDPVTTNTYHAENRGLGIKTNSTDFSALLQSILNRGTEGFSFKFEPNPFFTNAYVMTNTVVVTNWGTWSGDLAGNPTVAFRAAPGLAGPLFQLGDYGKQIGGISGWRDIRFEGDQGATNCAGVELRNVVEPIFAFCEFTGFKATGIRVASTNSMYWTYVDNCWFVQKWSSSQGITFTKTPIENQTQCHFRISGSTFGGTGGNGIIVSNWFPSLNISGNKFFGLGMNDGIGIYAGEDLTIANNDFQNLASIPIWFYDQATATNFSSSVTGNNTAGDGPVVLLGDKVQGVFLSGNSAASGTEPVSFTGNNGFPVNFDRAELRLGFLPVTNRVLFADANGKVTYVTGSSAETEYVKKDGTVGTPSGGSGSPGGTTTTIQYNQGGAFAGSSNFVYSEASQIVDLWSTGANPAITVGYTNSTTGTTNKLLRNGMWMFTPNGAAGAGVAITAAGVQNGFNVYTNRVSPLVTMTSDLGDATLLWRSLYLGANATIGGSLTVTGSVSQVGDGTTPASYTLFGTNDIGVTTKAAISNSVSVTNVVGLVHKAYAAYIAVNCNLEQDVHITNRIAGNVIVDWLNAAQGQTLKLRLHGAAATGSDYFVTNTFPSGWLVANQSSNSAPLTVQLPVSVLDGTGAELNIRNYRLFTGTTNIAGAIINTYTE